METSIMVSLKVMVNFILPLETTMWDNLDLTRRKEEVSILGLESRAMSMRESSREEKGMEKELSGGQMVAGMKVSSEMEYNQAGEYSIVKADIDSTRATGTMVCLMAREHNTSRTVNVTRVHSSRTNSTETAYSTKTTR